MKPLITPAGEATVQRCTVFDKKHSSAYNSVLWIPERGFRAQRR
jgi:hypothetical protein